MWLLDKSFSLLLIVGLAAGCTNIGVTITTADWRTKAIDATVYNNGGGEAKSVNVESCFVARQLAAPSTPNPTIQLDIGVLDPGDEETVHVDFGDVSGADNAFLRHTYRLDASVSPGGWNLLDNVSRRPVFSSNLPIMIIDTGNETIEDEPKIDGRMGIVRNQSELEIHPTASPSLVGPAFVFPRNYIYDPPQHYMGNIGIEIRGKSSQHFCKKSYGLELRDIAGEDEDHALLGMPSESDWVLHGPYSDKTLLRNHIAYDTWRQMGHAGVRSTFIEVFMSRDALGEVVEDCEALQQDFWVILNDSNFANIFQYVGVYLLVEKIKRNPNRVAITKLRSSDNTEATISGGYILKIDKTDPGDGWFITDQGTRVLYVDPKPDKITAAQEAWIANYVNEFETTLNGATFADPVNGYAKYIDVASFVDFYLLQEVFKNIDGLRISTYFHKERNGTLVMGPAWDFNLSMKNAHYCEGFSATGWYLDESSCIEEGGYPAPFWWRRLLDDPAYKARLVNRWTELRSEILSGTRLNSFIDAAVNELSEAHARNFSKWLTIGLYIWPNPAPVPSTYAAEIGDLKTWIEERLTWIDANITSL